MQWARLVVGSCAALALTAIALDAEARGRGGSGGRGGAHAGHGHHFHHGGARVFVGAGFVAWPAAYYWPGYYYPPAYYAPAAVMPAPQYWYYCAAAAAYYPYVQSCPDGWELVLPTPPHPY
jgi:hypothetical protein